MSNKDQNPLVAFKTNLNALHEKGELDMLPSNVSYEAFRNAAVVAVTDNPEILRCNKESVFRSVRRLAAAGLVPDGREAAIVPFKGQAQAMPMIFGIIKQARNSGQVSYIWYDAVYEGESLRVWIENGERKFDHDYDPLNRGKVVVGAYASAKMKDGTTDVEIMDKEQIERRRRASANQKDPQKPSGVWELWYDEMAKKTVVRALCKRLPVSSDDLGRILIDDEAPVFRDVTPEHGPETKRKNLAQRLQDVVDPVHGEILGPEDQSQDDQYDETCVDPTSEAFSEGEKAGLAGLHDIPCPYATNPALSSWMEGRRAGLSQKKEA